MEDNKCPIETLIEKWAYLHKTSAIDIEDTLKEFEKERMIMDKTDTNQKNTIYKYQINGKDVTADEYIQQLQQENEELEEKLAQEGDSKYTIDKLIEANKQMSVWQKKYNDLKAELISWNEMAISANGFVVDVDGCKKRIEELKQSE